VVVAGGRGLGAARHGALYHSQAGKPRQENRLGARRFGAAQSGVVAIDGKTLRGSVLNFVYLPRSMRFQILKRRSARRTLWRTGCGLQTIP